MEARANPAQAASATSGSETPGAAPRRGGRFRGRGPDRDFDPRPLREALIPLLREIDRLPSDLPEPLPSEVLDPILRRHPRPGGGYFSRSELIAGQRAFAAEAGFVLDAARFRRRLQRRPVRSQSGVTPLTVLTKPFPCPGQCIFCPNDVRMPKSYLSDEPGAQRAAQNRFDPYLQTWNRLAAFDATGHPIDKVELIVLGGTWSFYPETYQIDFVRRCLEALSDYGEGLDRRAAPRPRIPDFEAIDARVDGAGFSKNPYNARVGDFLRRHADDPLLESAESAASSDWASLERAQHRNESAGSRCVGLVLETRPDHVTEAEILRLRRLGATKVQLGVQQLDDAILAANRRGHDVAATRRAFRLLRQAGFKIHAHWMANLLGATPESDARDFAKLFDDPDFRPDELKLYPCSLIETAELMRHWQSGAWRPYAEKELLDVVAGALARVPRYCRVTRVIRDISSDDIVVGNKRTNFRQIAEAEVARRGQTLCEIRAREIRGEAFETESLRVVATEYAASGARQVFLELVTPADRIVGFLRLSLPDTPACIDELGRSAIVRELHVYGGSVALGDDAKGRAQHRGLGARLLEEAARIARAAGHASLAVISAIGTRAYYRRQGFADGTLYQHRALGDERADATAVASDRTDPLAPRAATQTANWKRLQARLRGLVGKAIADYGMIAPGDRVMVCLSGGKDSYTLLDLLLSQQRAAPVDFELVAVNLDQKQPGFPEHVLPEYLRALGVPFHILEQDTYSVVQRVVPAGKTQCGLCSRLRRGALYRFARENGIDKIALGHHRDDIVETLFLNLFHAGRLKAMPPKLLSEDGRNVVIRPLCYVPEREIVRYARARDFPIIPCTLCGSQPNLQRKAIAAMLAEWERADPGRIDTIFHALRHVHVSQLADPVAFDFAALVREAGGDARQGGPEAGRRGDDAALGRGRDAAAERDDAIAEALITGTLPLEDVRERVTLWPD